MADHDNVPYIVIERHNTSVTPFLWGLLLGAGAALLFAPRSGEETQEEIRHQARRLRTAAEDRVEAVRSTVGERIEQTRNEVQDRVDSALAAFDDRANPLWEKLEGTRQQVAHAGEELRQRAGEVVDRFDAESDRPAGGERGEFHAPPTRSGDSAGLSDVEVEEADDRPGLG